MIPVRGYKGYKVGVLGLGRSGLATAQSLKAGGAQTLCWDDNEAMRISAQQLGFEIVDLTKDKNWQDVVALIVSPGVAHLYPAPHPIVERAIAHGAVLDNEIGLFFRSFATQDWENFDMIPRVIAVTGSNGKSTTSALIGHILNACGRNVQVAGNIGQCALAIEPASDGAVVVLELSSYQIELARALAPDVAVFLNLSPDHLDRHGGMGGYFAAKQRLFTQGCPDRAIIGVDEMQGRFLANQLRQETASGDPVIAISAGQKLAGDGWSVCARKGFLAEWRKARQINMIDLRALENLPGVHNHQNVCAAYGACRSLGLPPKQIEQALRSFKGLAHRCELVGVYDGVRYINDSKATNADAAAQSLRAFENIHWIVGGRAKEGGIQSLTPLFDRVKHAYLIGEAAPQFAQQLQQVAHSSVVTIKAALSAMQDKVQDGDVVLLAPAAASFDQFSSFEERGELFKEAVKSFHSSTGNCDGTMI